MYKVAEIELSYRSRVKASERIKVSSSSEAHDIFRHHWDKNEMELREEFKVLFLNRGSHCLGMYDLSKGGVSGTIVDIKLIFSAALKANASGLIMCHNHPSGNLKPSKADINLTRKVGKAGSILDITLLDHLIITAEDFYSMANNGLI